MSRSSGLAFVCGLLLALGPVSAAEAAPFCSWLWGGRWSELSAQEKQWLQYPRATVSFTDYSRVGHRELRASGYVVPLNSDGTLLERTAEVLWRKLGHRLVIADASFKTSGLNGFQETTSELTYVDPELDPEIVGLIFLTRESPIEVAMKEVLPHEGAHAYLTRMGMGAQETSYSLVYFNQRIPKDRFDEFYHHYLSAQETLTWLQDVLRNSRAVSESKVQALLKNGARVKLSKIFDVNELKALALALREILRKSERAAKDAWTAVNQTSEDAISVVEEYGVHFIEMEVDSHRKVRTFFPIEYLNRPGMKKRTLKWQLEEQVRLLLALQPELTRWYKMVEQSLQRGTIDFQEYRAFRAALTKMVKRARVKPRPLTVE